ncbi:MAG TPA: tetratricopeptide repeat protein [Flavisolibacter sp.]|nr:tetratricopeptide repeat protein [Flavisolibacter sp.]
MKIAVICFCLFLSFIHVSAQDDLDAYINRLKKSQATGGKETAFMSAGSDFLYGQGYFEAKNYDMAAMYFKQVVNKEPDNPYFNYQLAISLIRQKDRYKTEEAQAYLAKAFTLNPNLKSSFIKESSAIVSKEITGVKKDTNSKETGVAGKTESSKAEGLEAYLEELKYSRSTGGPKTTMNSPGLDVIYGNEYYENGEYASAATRFRLAVAKDPEDIYANYLLGVSLAAQGKQKEASAYLDKAYAGDVQLKSRYEKDSKLAKDTYQKKEAAKVVKTTPATKPVYGGALVFGNYNCTETRWNGPNASPAYSFPPKGYFALKPDGTYRWLDDGETGRYSYDAKTGTIKWLSGYFANIAKKPSKFQVGTTVSQITVNFSDSYKWECGCNKK